MIRNIIIALAALLLPAGAAVAADVVAVGSASGNVGSRVEVGVALDLDNPEVAAAEIHIPLPEMATPVAGSCMKVDSRLPGHQVKADLRGGEYVIVIFDLGLARIPAGSGEAVRFALDLGENPGRFSLTPTVKLSDAGGNVIPATTEGGTLEVLGSRLELGATDIDFGRVPIRGTYTRTVTATNTGTTPLHIDDFTTDIPGLGISAAETVVAPGASTVLTLTYKPTERAKSVAGRFTALSNSVGRAPYVRVSSVPFSVNELHTGSASGVSDEEVTVGVAMNNMEPIVGAEVTYRLPEALEYVDGSVALSPRASNLTAKATVDAQRRLRIILFGLDNRPVGGDDGDLFSFRLRLDGRSGSYSLTPENVKLVNAAEENMVSASTAGNVSISSPRISGNSRMNVGNVPLSGSDTFYYTVSNYGSAPLRIDRVTFLDDIAECPAQMPIEVPVYDSAEIPVKILNPAFGAFATTMNIYCNDPASRLLTVDVSGKFYSPNEMSFNGILGTNGDTYTLEASLANEAPITALQLDILPPVGTTIDESSFVKSSRAESHNATVVKVAEGRYRLIIFSLSNKPFDGDSGALFSLTINGEGLNGKQFRVENIKLSGTDGVNYTSPATDLFIGEIRPTLVQDIKIDPSTASIRVGETVQLTATVLPETATDKSVVWKSSNTEVATVDADGLVTAVAVGEADITATAGDVSASVVIVVEKTPIESIVITADANTLYVGDTLTLIATVLPDDATDKRVEWSLSESGIVAITDYDNNEATVEALASGEVTVVASSTDGISADYLLKVKPNPISSLAEITIDGATIAAGNGRIIVSGTGVGTTVRLFAIDGVLLKTVVSEGSDIIFDVAPKSYYIINIGTRSAKIYLK